METTSATILPFPHGRLIGTARWLLDLAETQSDEIMSFVWEDLMDELEARLIQCGCGIEVRARELNSLWALVQIECERRLNVDRDRQPDEAA